MVYALGTTSFWPLSRFGLEGYVGAAAGVDEGARALMHRAYAERAVFACARHLRKRRNGGDSSLASYDLKYEMVTEEQQYPPELESSEEDDEDGSGSEDDSDEESEEEEGGGGG